MTQINSRVDFSSNAHLPKATTLCGPLANAPPLPTAAGECPTVHGRGVIGANAIRESSGTLPFDVREGDTRLPGTGVTYQFDWLGARRSLQNLTFDANGDYWAYAPTRGPVPAVMKAFTTRPCNAVL